ncbi:hypothetical protein V2J09_003863 [Rumex salicifolius]
MTLGDDNHGEAQEKFPMSLIKKVYLNSDSLCKAVRQADNDESIYTSDYLNNIRCSSVPIHILKVKIIVPIILLNNIDQSSGNNIGHIVLIPRMCIRHFIFFQVSTKTIFVECLFFYDEKQVKVHLL